MKKLVFLGLVLLLAGSTPVQAVDVAGVLENIVSATSVDSVIWYLISSPAPVFESTPGWGGQTPLVDTHQFQPLSEWPASVRLFYNVNGLPGQFLVEPVRTDTWYEFPPALDLQSTRVMFEDTILVGIASEPRVAVRQVLSCRPNPARGIVRLELSPGVIGPVEIADRSGRVVCVLTHLRGTAVWDGLDAAGVRVEPGVYFAGLAGSRERAKLVRLE